MATKRKGKAKAKGAEAVIRERLAERLAEGQSLRDVAAAAGYSDHSQLSRFLRGERGGKCQHGERGEH